MKTSRILMLGAVVTLGGCSTSASHPQPSCQVMTEPICSRVAEEQLHDGTLAVSYAFRQYDERVVPFVVPVFTTDGALATVVDCYAKTDSRTFSMVQSNLAIPASSEETVNFLRSRHLCAEEESYAENASSNDDNAADSTETKTLLADAGNHRDRRSDEGAR